MNYLTADWHPLPSGPHVAGGRALALCGNSPEALYWSGFICADGSINKSGRRLTIALADRDALHLHKLATLLKTRVRRDGPHSVRASLQDPIGVPQWSEKYGVGNRKTYSGMPNPEWMIDDELIAFFVGYADGDGCIRCQSNRKDMTLSFHIHRSWGGVAEYMIDRIYRIFGYTFSGHPSITKRGFVSITVGSNYVLSNLKRRAVWLKVPLLDRKWDKVPAVYSGRREMAAWRASAIRECVVNGGLPAGMVANLIGVCPSAVSNMVRRHHMRG